MTMGVGAGAGAGQGGGSVRAAAIVPAAGSGQRLGAGIPKALVPLHGEPILAHAVRCLVAEPRVALVVLCAPVGLEAQIERAALAASGGVPVRVVTGGATRAESVARGLAAVPEEFGVVLVHDAARCLVPREVVAAVVDRVAGGAAAVVPGLPVVDTIREVDASGGSHTIDRSVLRAVQTPQGFRADALRQAHAAGDPGATDDAGMVEALGLPVAIVPGHPRAFKVTTELDLVLADAIVSADRARGASGGDPPGGG